jgi:hypothetical protein
MGHRSAKRQKVRRFRQLKTAFDSRLVQVPLRLAFLVARSPWTFVRAIAANAAERRDTGGGNSGHSPLRKPTAMILGVLLSRSTVAEPNFSPGHLMRELDGHERILQKSG